MSEVARFAARRAGRLDDMSTTYIDPAAFPADLAGSSICHDHPSRTTGQDVTDSPLRRLSGWLGTLLRSATHHQVDELSLPLTAEHRRLLEAFAKGRWVSLRFPATLETYYRAFSRESAKLPRVLAALLTAILFLSAPLWTGPLLDVPEKTRTVTLYLSLVALGPMFLLLSYTIWKWPRSNLGEYFLMAAFLGEVVAIEALRIIAEGHGYYVSAVMSLAVPIAVLAVGRLSFFRSLMLVVLYIGLLEVKRNLYPNLAWQRHATDFLAMFIILGICLISTAFIQRNQRRIWALLQLARLRADVDYLTGLPNRSAFEQHVERWARWGRRKKTSYVIALVDLDFFKRINDRYGHPFGDGVLLETGMVLSAYARRAGDMAARIGGEEFALFLFDCDAKSARSRLDDLRRAIKRLDIVHEDSPMGVVTASIGAVAISNPEPISSSYQRADENLFAVKRSGRNGAIVSEQI